MTRLTWDDRNQVTSGIDQVAIFPKGGSVVAWSGVTGIEESYGEQATTPRYLDGVELKAKSRSGAFSGTISGFSIPSMLLQSSTNGLITRRTPLPFHMSYRVRKGSYYRIQFVYNVLLSGAQKAYAYQVASEQTWEFTTLPVAVPNYQPSSRLMIDTEWSHPDAISKLEDMLYGTSATRPFFPMPSDLSAAFEANLLFKVTDHGDGLFTIEAPDNMVRMVDATTFEVDSTSVAILGNGEYTVQSL